MMNIDWEKHMENPENMFTGDDENVAEPDLPSHRDRHQWIVAVYDCALGYGGPEEGGWWFDTGSLTRIVRVFASEDRAYQYCRKLNTRLRCRTWGPNEGKRDKSSVLSDGFFEACVYMDHAPKGFPDVRPHYE